MMSPGARDGVIAVTGSAIVRLEPDTAIIAFTVARDAAKPEDALQACRDTALRVADFVKEFGSVGLKSAGMRMARTSRPGAAGYEATQRFAATLGEVDRLDALMSGLLWVGVGGLDRVEFASARLRETRAKVRLAALAAARSKAQSLCTAAGLKLGAVTQITEGADPCVGNGAAADDDEAAGSYSPDSIAVGASLVVHYQI